MNMRDYPILVKSCMVTTYNTCPRRHFDMGVLSVISMLKNSRGFARYLCAYLRLLISFHVFPNMIVLGKYTP